MPLSARRRAWILGWLASAAALGSAPDDPLPVVTWAAGPLEACVAFDRPLNTSVAKDLLGKTISFDEAVRTVADFKAQASRPQTALEETRGSIRIAAARVTDNGRTLVLATDPHPREAAYVLPLPVLPRSGRTREPVYDLTGVEAAWDDGRADSRPSWSGWWPHYDPDAARALTAGSVEHERGFALLARPGRLVLSTLVRLPKGHLTLQIAASGPLEATLGGENGEAQAPDRTVFQVESTGDPIDLSMTVVTGSGGKPLSLHATYRVGTDSNGHPLTRDNCLVPWAPTSPPAPTAPAAPIPNLTGGDRLRGEALFSGVEAKCASCHKVRGKGGEVGPDLSDLTRRDPAWVYRSIAEPSATIRPDYVSYTVATKDGRVVVGVVRAEGADAIRVTDTEAKTTIVLKSDIDQLRPSATSIMPVGLAGALGEARLRDLIAFLLATGAEK